MAWSSWHNSPSQKLRCRLLEENFEGGFEKGETSLQKRDVGLPRPLMSSKNFFPTSGCTDSFYEKPSLILTMDNRSTPCPVLLLYLVYSFSEFFRVYCFATAHLHGSVLHLSCEFFAGFLDIQLCMAHRKYSVCATGVLANKSGIEVAGVDVYPGWG